MKTTFLFSTGLILLSLMACSKAGHKQITLAPESSTAFQKADEGLRCDLISKQERKEVYLKLETKNQITTASFHEFDADGNPTDQPAEINGLKLSRLVGKASLTDLVVKGTMIQETALSVSDDKAIMISEVPVTLIFKARTEMQGVLSKPKDGKGKKNKVMEEEAIADLDNCEKIDTDSH